MQRETDPKGLSWPIKPSVIVDDLSAGIIHVSLSPEIPVSPFLLKQCFERVPFKGESKKEWAKVLREIAEELEK